MRPATVVLFLAWLIGSWMPQPAAQSLRGTTLCADYRTIVELLARRYDERPLSLGLGDDGSVVELFTSKEGDSWTMLRVAPNGRSCVLATGKNWQRRHAAVDGPDA